MPFRNAVVLFGATLLGFAAWFPPAEDELYYWTWAKSLSLSYFDHPPMVAWLIALTTGIFGDSLFAIRLVSVAASVGTLCLLSQLTANRDKLVPYFFCPAFFIFSLFVTPDIPLLFFWALYIVVLARLVDDEPQPLGRWAFAGVVLGAGLLSKYTMGIAALSSLLVIARNRAVFRRSLPGYALHAAISTVVFLPVVIFNARHGFEPLRFQLEHGARMGIATLKTFGECLAGQMLLWSALPLLVLPLCLRRWRDWRRDPKAWAAFCLSAPALMFFLFQASRRNIEANWPAPAMLGLLVLSTVTTTSRWRALAFTPAWLFSLYFFVNAITPLPVGPVLNDRYRLLEARYDVAKKIAADFPGERMFAPNYQWVATLRFAGLPAEHGHPMGRRNHFTLVPQETCLERSVLLFIDKPTAPLVFPCFDKRETLKEYSLSVRNEQIVSIVIMRLSRQ